MTLSKNSWHYWVHKTAYGEERPLPNNLCTYFWKSIIGGMILVVILLPLALPFILLARITRVSGTDYWFDWKAYGVWSKSLFIGITLYTALWLVFSMVGMWIWPKIVGIMVGGTIGWLMTVFILVELIHDYIKNRREMRLMHIRPKPKKPNIIVEAIKAWYKKNCPLIKWEEK